MGSEDDRQRIARRVREQQTVHAHVLVPASGKAPSRAEKLRAWDLLDDPARMRITGGDVRFPEKGTIRGLRVVDGADGPVVRWTYQRGGHAPLEDAGRPGGRTVIAQGLEGAAVLLDMFAEEDRKEQDGNGETEP